MAFASKFADTRNIPIAQTAIASKMMAVGVDADPSRITTTRPKLARKS